jgi:hypothetical protein
LLERRGREPSGRHWPPKPAPAARLRHKCRRRPPVNPKTVAPPAPRRRNHRRPTADACLPARWRTNGGAGGLDSLSSRARPHGASSSPTSTASPSPVPHPRRATGGATFGPRPAAALRPVRRLRGLTVAQSAIYLSEILHTGMRRRRPADGRIEAERAAFQLDGRLRDRRVVKMRPSSTRSRTSSRSR